MTIPEVKRLTSAKEEIERAKSQFQERLIKIEAKYRVSTLINLKSEVVIRK